MARVVVKARKTHKGFELGSARLEYIGQDDDGTHLWVYSRSGEQPDRQPLVVVDDSTAMEIFKLLGGEKQDGK